MSLNPRGNQQNTLDSNLDEMRLANGNASYLPKAQDFGLKSPATPALDSSVASDFFSSPNPKNQRTNDATLESSQIPQNPQGTQGTQNADFKEVLANDLPVQNEPQNEPKPYATTKQRKLALNAGVINAINAKDADEALDFLATQNTNISWDLVEQMRKNGTKSAEILAGIAKESAQNPQSLWIDLETPLNKKELAKNRYKYERSQITQENLDSLKEANKFLSTSTLGDIIGLDALKSKEAQANEREAQLTLQKFAEQGYEYDSLPKEAQDLLKKQGSDTLTTLSSIFSATSAGKIVYEKLQTQAKIYQKIKNKEPLSEQEKSYIDSYGEGAGFGDDAEKQQQWLMKYEAKNVIPQFAQDAIHALENKSDYKALIFGSTEGKEKDKARFNNGIKGVAIMSGFDDGYVDEKSGDILFEKDGYLYQVNTRFLDNFANLLKSNAFSIGGSILGATKGFKTTKNLVGLIGGGVLGAFVGGSIDATLADIYTKNKINFAENLRHGLHEGIFNIAGDLAVAGAIKAGKYALKGAKSLTPQGAKDFLGKVVEYTPILGFAKRAIDGNAKAVENLIKQTYTPEQIKALKDFSQDFGINLRIGHKNAPQNADFIAQKFGQEHSFTKAANKIQEIFSLENQSQKQTAFINAIRADESGNLLAFLTEIANQSPQVQQNLKSILNQTTAKLKNQLENLGLKNNEIKEVFNAYEQGTKDSYNEAVENIIKKVYDDNYKTTLSQARLDEIQNSLTQRGILADTSAPFLQFIKNNIYNAKGVSFDNLNNTLKTLNAYYKDIKDPNFKSYIDNSLKDILRQDIKAGIDSIFLQNSAMAKNAQTLFATALADYGNMKSVLKNIDKLKIRDAQTSYKKSFDSMLKFLQGQGDEISNFKHLSQNLDKEAKKRFEIGILNELFNASLTTQKDLQVFNSTLFFERLKFLEGEFDTLLAKDFIKIAEGYHKLFKNDVLIAESIKPSTTQKIGSSIATTIQGAAKMQATKAIFSQIIRLMPNIPSFVPFSQTFNEKIGGAALRYHLRSALEKSHSVSELKFTLQEKIKRGNFDNPTKQIINKITNQVDKAQDEILHTAKQAQTSNETLKDFGQNPQPKSSLESAPAQKMPAELNQDELENILSQFDNVENIKKHFIDKPDEKQRYALFSLLQETMLDPLIKYTSAGKQKYIQKFSTNNEAEPFFYLLITQDKDKTFITHFKTRDTEYLLNDIAKADEVLKGADLIGKFTSWGGNSSATKPTSTNQLNGKNESIAKNNPTSQAPQQDVPKNPYKSIFELAKEQKEAKQKALLEKQQADSEYIAKKEAEKRERINKILEAQKASQGQTTLEARAKIKAEQMGQDVPYQKLADTHIILDDITYPAEFVIIDKNDLKPSFEAGGFQTREVKQDDKIANIRDNFDPLKIFGKIGEYDGLPLIARNGEIIAGNHRGEAIKHLSGENLAKYKNEAKKVFGIDLEQDKIIVRRILDDTESENGANL
ncbi:hypothetical protein, partial [Helicobacter sp. T3_23-1056]